MAGPYVPGDHVKADVHVDVHTPHKPTYGKGAGKDIKTCTGKGHYKKCTKYQYKYKYQYVKPKKPAYHFYSPYHPYYNGK